MKEEIYWLGFATCNGIGPTRFKKLLNIFTSAENAWNATEAQLQQSGIGEIGVKTIIAHRKKFNPQAYAEQLAAQNISYVTLKSSSYPKTLASISNPPFVLYLKGNTDYLKQKPNGINDKHIAVVGTRKITDYGLQVTEMITNDLASNGCIIVSVLALGVDTVAHRSALQKGGKTIAVLGSGINICTPHDNSWLYSQILEKNSLIVSEYGLGVQPNKGSFPARNRIIAGLSLGVLVTEGAEDSGSLITAKYAKQYGRKVFAVPGPITSTVSRGPITLISQGASLITSAKNIMDELKLLSNINTIDNKLKGGDTREERIILSLLEHDNLYFDEIVRLSGLSSAIIAISLSLLEMKSIVKSLPSGQFTI